MINLSFYLFISGYISCLYYQNNLKSEFEKNNNMDYLFIVYFFITYLFSYILYLSIQNTIYCTKKILNN